MSDNPKRKWFQFHLSTAIVGMFATGCFLWANFSGRLVRYDNNPELISQCVYGWPYIAYVTDELMPNPTSNYWPKTFFREGMYLNSIVGFIILFVVTMLSEYIIRCRKAKKP